MINQASDIDSKCSNLGQSSITVKQSSLQLYSEFQLREKPEDQLIMTNFKTQKCENQSHLQQVQIYAFSCQAYHGNFDKRRPLFDLTGQLKYSELQCPNILQHQLLIKLCSEDCPYSHNQFEENYHPAKFRVFPCDNANHLSDSSPSSNDGGKSDERCLNEMTPAPKQTCHKYHEHSQIRFNAQKYFNQIQAPFAISQATIPSNIQPCSMSMSSLPGEQSSDKIIKQQNFTIEALNYNELGNANNQINKFPGMATNESSGKTSDNNSTLNSFNGADVNCQISQSQQSTLFSSQSNSLQQTSLTAQSQQYGVSQYNQNVPQNFQAQTFTQVSHHPQTQNTMQQFGSLSTQQQAQYLPSYNQQSFYNGTQGVNMMSYQTQNNGTAAISSQLQQLKLNHMQQHYPSNTSTANQNNWPHTYLPNNFSNSFQNQLNPSLQTFSQSLSTSYQGQLQTASDQTNSGSQPMKQEQNLLQESSQPFIPSHKKQQSLHDQLSSTDLNSSSSKSGQNSVQSYLPNYPQSYQPNYRQQSAQTYLQSQSQGVQASSQQQQQQQQNSNNQQNSLNSYSLQQNQQYQIINQQTQNHNYYQMGQGYQYQNQSQRYPNHSSNLNQMQDLNQRQSYSSQNNAFIKAQQNQVFEIYYQSSNESIRHLILKDFKTEQCPIQYQHNHKHCKFFHSIKDKRRVRDSVSPDLCDFAETEKCPKQDSCSLAHNKVERLYHTEKYKTKFCTKFPKQLANCDYGEYCSFAHSQTDLKTRIIHTMQKDADYYQFYFKTEWCPFNKEHNKAQCDYAHNWQDFRRKPHIFNYNAHELCQNWQAGTFIGKYEEGCILQAACLRSHGWKEQEYHPLYYKTRPCPEVKCGQINQCPFYHTEQDKRIVNSDNHQQILFPKLRVQNEQLATITLRNIVLNNVNHLKEFLINNGLNNMSFQQLQVHLQSTNPPTPTVLLQYFDVKGVVASERMRQLVLQNEHHIYQMSMLQQNQALNSQPIQMQHQMQQYHQSSQVMPTQMQYQPSYIQPPPGFEPQFNQSLPQNLQIQGQLPNQLPITQSAMHERNIQPQVGNQIIAVLNVENRLSSEQLDAQIDNQFSSQSNICSTQFDQSPDQLRIPLQNNEQPTLPGLRTAKTEIIQAFNDEAEEEKKANQQNGSTDTEEEKDFTNSQPLTRQMTSQQTMQQPIITVEQFTSSNPSIQNRNKDRKNQFRKLGKGNSTENNTLSGGNHLASNLETLETGLALKSGRASPVGSKFLSNQQLTLTDEIQQYQPSNLVVPSFLNPNVVVTSPKTSPKSKQDQPSGNALKGLEKTSFKANDLKSEDSIFGANQQDEEGRSNGSKGASEDEYDNEDEHEMTDSLFQKVMRKINDATSSQGGISGGGSTTKAVTIPIQEISQAEVESNKLKEIEKQNTERFNTNGYEVDSLSSGSLNTGNNATYNRQGTGQPVSYQNKLQQFEQEFLRVNSMNKSVRSIFSSSSKSKSKSNSAKGTKKKKIGDGSANPGSGSNQGIEGTSGGAGGVNDDGSELEKLSDASALSSNLGSTRSRKQFNKDLSPHAIDEEDLMDSNMD